MCMCICTSVSALCFLSSACGACVSLCVCLPPLSMHVCVHPTPLHPPSPPLSVRKWESELVSVWGGGGGNRIFWALLLYVCQTCCTSIAVTPPSLRLLLSKPEKAPKLLFFFSFFCFFTALREKKRCFHVFPPHHYQVYGHFAPTTLKSISYLLGYKSFPRTRRLLFICVCLCRISDVGTFLCHWFFSHAHRRSLLNAERITKGIWK